MSIEDVASGVKLAYWDLNKAAYQAARGTYKRAQNAGMRYQNWRHKGAGDETVDGADVRRNAAHGLTGMTDADNIPARKGKQWTSDEESFSNTTTSHTTYTRKRNR